MNTSTTQKAYAIAYLRDIDFGEAIIDYLQRIDATLAPYDGRFLVHGGNLEVAEGDWGGDIVIIEFPSSEAARGWYESPAYQAILPLRTEHSLSLAGLLEGVPEGYQATDKLAAMLATQTAS
jgi:uncharacterized protein (DUF1330 family)